MFLVLAVPVCRFDIAGDSGLESSLSDSSVRSPSRAPGRFPFPPAPPTLLYNLLSSTFSADPGMTEDTTNVRTVRCLSFKSGNVGPPLLFTERFCRLCSREYITSPRSRSASVNSYKNGVYSRACCCGLKTEGNGDGRNPAIKSASSNGRPSNGCPTMYKLLVNSWHCSRIECAIAVVNSPAKDNSRAKLCANSSGEFKGLLISHSNLSSKVCGPIVMFSLMRILISSFL